MAGCGGSDDDSAYDRTAGADSGGAELAGDDSAAGESATGEALAAGAQVAGEGRDVIYTAELVVRVDDVEAASRSARDLVAASGGYVAQQSADLEGRTDASITLRVPPGGFDGLIDDLAALGEVLQRNLSTRDVTDQVVDLERRIDNAKVSAERLRQLLAEADGVPNVLAIEAELTKRETEIEVMTGQLQVVRDQVDLSTLTVRFTEVSETAPKVNDDLPGFVRSFKAGAVTVANIGLGLLAVVGFLLPFLPFAALGWFGWRLYRRRHPKAERVPAPAMPVWPSGPTSAGWVPGGTPPSPSPGPAPTSGPEPVASHEAGPGAEAGPTPLGGDDLGS